MQRHFVAKAPNTRWTADITYVPTWSGFLYLAVILDVFSRRIVGWAMADHVCTELVLSALEMDPGRVAISRTFDSRWSTPSSRVPYRPS
jgi:transposase InsO family protein